MNKTVTKIAIALIIGGIFFLLAFNFFSIKQAYLIGIVAFMVTLWTNEALPLGVVSLFPIILFPAFGILSTNATSINYSKSIIFLFLGGFMLAIAVEKTNLHKIIADKILSLFPPTPKGIIYSLLITSAILSSFLSNTTTALLLLPIGMFITENKDLKMRFVLSIAYGASIGGIITPIGTPPNLILLGIMEDKGLEMIPFLKWIFMIFPLALIMLIFTGWILSIGAKNIPLKREMFEYKITKEQKKVSFAIIALILVLLINTPIKPYYEGLGLNEKGILLFFGLLMFMPPFNILEWEDSKKIPFEIIFLFGAGFAIAKAFSNTKLDHAIAEYLLNGRHISILDFAFDSGFDHFYNRNYEQYRFDVNHASGYLLLYDGRRKYPRSSFIFVGSNYLCKLCFYAAYRHSSKRHSNVFGSDKNKRYGKDRIRFKYRGNNFYLFDSLLLLE